MIEKLKLLNNLNILLVEDDIKTANEMKAILKLIFKNVFYAKNGIDALTIYKENFPEIILTDIEMKEMNGLELLKEIRKKDHHTIIVILSAHSEQKLLLDVINSSCSGYILKPINADRLVNQLYLILRNNTTIDKDINLFENVKYNLLNKELIINNKVVPLGSKEHMLLKLFLTINKKVINKNDINYYLYPFDSITDSAIKNLIIRLKNKLGKDSIIFVPGAGWKLNISKNNYVTSNL
ncbi:response regulator receiver protein [Arcobacter nitrofigilis DSM 7299]|uniref:Response regulator receiver protein n=1 Tax=Arcobacter nitrofigilis (strain ATCC 33309 / DSM 7299 / CCUG 15893 / LMG 7604 / NCTC 12251 / CI) TaxID=572480 RepID=D5V5Z5_ARCNC|nr:response regulator [Arcobacter nitrofigilis]ADG93162.1 response regulator receiver protein [Arcobacter nitrofigilis DSM 7299]